LITFDYISKTSQEITFGASTNWMIQTKSALSVSDSYLYVRNIDEVTAGNDDKFHAAYYIYGDELIPYFNRVDMTDSEKADLNDIRINSMKNN